MIIIIGVLLALLITFKSDDLFSVNFETSKKQEIVLPDVAEDLGSWMSTLKKNSQYIYHTYQSIR
ncbi:MAG: hypothetical protein AAFO69_15605, partial [Bacteroidota bacterium]